MDLENIERKYNSARSEFTSEDKMFWERLIELATSVEKSQDKISLTDSMKKLNDFLKENHGRINQKYVMRYIIDNFPILREKYIIESEPFIDKNTGINYSDAMSAEEKVNHIAQKMRIILANASDEGYEYSEDFIRNQDLAGECILTTERVVKDCEKKGIKAKGYSISETIGTKNRDNHYFAIITIDDKQYIVDCTYRQFFTIRNNVYDRCRAGLIMLADEERRKVAEQILKNGWVEATTENLKAYLDGFALSKSEKTPSAEEYAKILEGKSIQYKEKFNIGRKNNPETSETIYIMDSRPHIEQDMLLDEFNVEMSDEEKITRIVQKERRTLSQLVDKNGMPYDINNDNLRGDCIASAERICEDCFSKGIIATDFHTVKKLKINRNLGHHFTIIELSGKNYLIDCTYRQFFSKTNNSPEKEQHDCGMYMVADEERRKVAKQILKNGWIEATPENLKAYLDGFVMADRRNFGETGISYEDYVEMLKKDETIKFFTHSEIAELDKQEKITQGEIIEADKLLLQLQNVEKSKTVRDIL